MLHANDSAVQLPTRRLQGSRMAPFHAVHQGSSLKTGDIVWAKVKYHPWWPGQIFDPALASSTVRKSWRQGQFLVLFYYDFTFAWCTEGEVLPFEPCFREKSNQTSARNFLAAIEDALEEIRKRFEEGLTGPCKGLRETIEPSKMVAFVKKLACFPLSSDHDRLWSTKAAAQMRVFRAVTFSSCNPKYEECPTNSLQELDGEDKVEPEKVLKRAMICEGGFGVGTKQISREDTTQRLPKALVCGIEGGMVAQGSDLLSEKRGLKRKSLTSKEGGAPTGILEEENAAHTENMEGTESSNGFFGAEARDGDECINLQVLVKKMDATQNVNGSKNAGDVILDIGNRGRDVHVTLSLRRKSSDDLKFIVENTMDAGSRKLRIVL